MVSNTRRDYVVLYYAYASMNNSLNRWAIYNHLAEKMELKLGKEPDVSL